MVQFMEIDDDLTFENHCNALANKVPKRIGLLKNIGPHLTRDHKRTYHKAIIKLALLYGANIWTSKSNENLKTFLDYRKEL